MAQRLGVSQDQYQEDLANSSMCNVLSLDALFEDREQTGRSELPDDTADSRPEDSMLRQELLETLTKAIESLRENEQTVISLYYHKKSQHEGNCPGDGGQRAENLSAPLPGDPEAEAVYEPVYDRRQVSCRGERSFAL